MTSYDGLSDTAFLSIILVLSSFDEKEEPDLSPEMSSIHHGNIPELVEDCLQICPEDRPSVDDVLGRLLLLKGKDFEIDDQEEDALTALISMLLSITRNQF